MSKRIDSSFEAYFTCILGNWKMFEKYSEDAVREINPGQSWITADFKNPPGDLIFRYTPQNSQFSATIFVSYGVKILKRYVNILTKEQKVANGSYLTILYLFLRYVWFQEMKFFPKGTDPWFLCKIAIFSQTMWNILET